MTMDQPNDEVSQYLKDHSVCVFATGRKDGSPQLSLIGYQFDGKEILLRGGTDSAKMKNIRRNTKNVAIAIVDGRKELIVYGSALLVSDPAEIEKLQARFGTRAAPPRAEGAPAAPARPPGVSVLVTPKRYLAGRMNG